MFLINKTRLSLRYFVLDTWFSLFFYRHDYVGLTVQQIAIMSGDHLNDMSSRKMSASDVINGQDRGCGVFSHFQT